MSYTPKSEKPTKEELIEWGVTDYSESSAGAWDYYHISAYTATCVGCIGITRTGVDVRDNTIDHRVVAVDPKYIPLDSIIEIEGLGYYTASDTGGAIKGKKLDLLVQSNKEANAWGRRNMRVRVIRRGKGNGSKITALKPGPGSPASFVSGSSSAKYSELPGNLSKVKDNYTYSPKTNKITQKNTSNGTTNANSFATVDSYTGFKLKAGLSLGLLDREMSKQPVPMSYPLTSYIYFVPKGAPANIRSVLSNNPSGVDGNLLSAIIANTSDWKENYNSNLMKGIAGLPDEYVKNVLNDTPEIYDPVFNVTSAADLFSAALKRFNGKITLALAAYKVGNIATVESIVKSSETLDFTVLREMGVFDESVINFVDNVLEDYLALKGADYLNGDPHKKTKGVSADNTDVDEINEEFIGLSDEERRFKVNLKRVEQALIRVDSEAVGSMDIAEQLIYQYAKYTMQVYRAKTHNVSVNLATCLPFLRLGQNVWIEPTYTDVVAYITNISHYGSFGNGCKTSVTAGYVRRPDDYTEVDTSVFVGKPKATSNTFGEIVEFDEMDAIRKKLKNMHENTETEMAHKIDYLKELYSSMNKENEFTTAWNKEMTKEEIETQLKSIYSNAPEVVKERKKEIADIITKSEDFFIEKLLFMK